MVVFAVLTIAAVLTAAGAGIRILKKEYLPLLRALSRDRHQEEEPPDREEEDP